MVLDAFLASLFVALCSLVGVLFFGNSKKVLNSERYIIPIAVGVFLSLVLYELIPETLSLSPHNGGIAIVVGFISFYVLANILHKRHHDLVPEDCERKGAASLVLIGDAVHNLADGFVLGGAFLINPAVGFITALGLAIHEVPQEIVEFGVLVRAGYSRKEAALRNFLSASSIILGTLIIILLSEHASNYTWVLTGFAAGNLLFLAASDLLPRVHGNLREYGGVWQSTLTILIGFVVMTAVITWTHEEFGHEGKNVHTEPDHVTEEKAPTQPDYLIPLQQAHTHENEEEHTHEEEHLHTEETTQQEAR